jgi:hypothetical protein
VWWRYERRDSDKKIGDGNSSGLVDAVVDWEEEEDEEEGEEGEVEMISWSKNEKCVRDVKLDERNIL